MLFRVYDHRTRSSVFDKSSSFDEAVILARKLTDSEPDRFLEVQRWDSDEGWDPTGWTFGVQGDWD